MVMQGTMLGVLLAAVGAAALVGRSREQRWAVALSPTPYHAGGLTVRLPNGWYVQPPATTQHTDSPTVTATEGAGRGEPREVQVIQIPVTPGESPSGLIETFLSSRNGIVGGAEPFRFLGQPGVLVQFTAIHESPHPLAPQLQEPQWYAATVLPSGDGQPSLGVVVGLLHGWPGPSGDRLLRQVAAGLERRDDAATQPGPPIQVGK